MNDLINRLLNYSESFTLNSSKQEQHYEDLQDAISYLRKYEGLAREEELKFTGGKETAMELETAIKEACKSMRVTNNSVRVTHTDTFATLHVKPTSLGFIFSVATNFAKLQND